MDKIYNPKNIEEKLYNFWNKNGYFKPNNNIYRNSFCIIMPPPNITGNLHMGHAFQQTIMDILIRYHRMQGENTLWQMGLDHAGIATQIIVLKKIQSENNIDINVIGRENFIKKCWNWKKKLTKNINYQITRLGNSIDWERTRFTLDKSSIDGVRKVFIKLYQDNLIYRKKKLSNWDTKLKTVISDLEIKHKTILGKMWYLKYPILNNSKKIIENQYIVIATTRPETLLGDTALAVHPDDIRYQNLIGKFVLIPIIDRCIPIIADTFVDMKKGTGCVKITPAHDFNDYEVALRNNLPLINIFTRDGNICNIFEIYDIFGNSIHIYNKDVPIILQGLNSYQARTEIVKKLENMQLIENIIEEKITVLYGDRSGSKIEPLLTDQWYLRTSKLSKEAISVILNQEINFFPKQYKNMYLSWMYNIQDWCISRQLWWGHRIPAWYDIKGNIYVGNNEKDVRRKYLLSENILLFQDPDVLDTWFSSSLWTFLSLGWPKTNDMLNIFHPTTVIISGFDIIFFWIARMIMMTIYVLKNENVHSYLPFKNIYITGLIKDEYGKKMSKSKGNVLDPIDIIDGISLPDLLKKRMSNHFEDSKKKKIFDDTKRRFPNGIKSFGADVLRFTFVSLSSINRNITWDMNRLQGYRNFCNKIWHAARFINMYISHQDNNILKHCKSHYFFNLWILTELNNTIKLCRRALDSYRFDIAASTIYDFFWNKFCNWYLEIIKIVFRFCCPNIIQNTQYILVYTFEKFLRLAHPIIPFITEYLWQQIKNILMISDKTIMLQSFPDFNNDMINNKSLEIMSWIQQMILFIRKIRIKFNINNITLFKLFICNCHNEYKRIIYFYKKVIKNLIYLKNIIFLDQNDIIPENIIMKNINGIKVFILLDKKLNIQIQLIQFKKKIYDIDKKIIKLKKNILNISLVQNQKEIIKKKNFLNALLLDKEKIVHEENIFLNTLNKKDTI